jgi:dipeptidyl aminopeptidase/acylaminoacyl peptidase
VVLPPGVFASILGNFDWFAQFLANRGYAVFQAGTRDTRSLGDVSGMDELGAWMVQNQDDIAAGVDDLVRQGIADPKRVCAAGSGDTAYIALFSAIYLPDKYACIISWQGISDLKKILKDARQGAMIAENIFNSSLVRNYEKYSEDDLVRFSPALHADQVRTPLLILDTNIRSWNRQSVEMILALRKAGKAVREYAVPEDDGALSRGNSRVVFLQQVDKFLSEHIGN